MRKVLAALVISVLAAFGLAAAPSGASTPSAAPGVSKDEIKVGITYPDLAAVRAAGAANTNHGDYEKSYQAVIDDLNKRGGINGRKVVPLIAGIDPLGTAPAQETCLKFTEDEPVFAAVGFFNADAPLCYAEKHDTPVLGGQITDAYLARAKAPWFTLDPGAEVAPRVIDTLAKAGAFKGGKVGIVAVAADEGLLDDVVLPALKRNGVTGTVAINDAPTTDVTAGNALTDTILERFRSDGIKTVLAVNNAIGGIVTGLGKTDWRPRLVATASGPLSAAASNPATNPSVIKDVISADVGIEFNEPSLQKCFQVVEKATGDKIVEYAAAGEPQPRISAQTACRSVALFAALAKAAGKNPTAASFGKAPQKLGSIEIPGAGAITYDPKTHTFAQPMFTYRYDPTLHRMVLDKQIT
jgi:ABC-type branched-subunit amino acid transport system substrate-binding protein